MGKVYLDKEKLVAEFFAGYKSDSLIISPEDFFLLKKNGILDAEIVLELQSEVEAALDQGCFAIINDERVNARAMEKNGVAIIALYAGTIKKILCDASIMMLSDDFLVGVGNMEACYPDIKIDDYEPSADEANDAVVKMTISGDPIREAVGYMIASLAVHFIVYHEIGHHKLGHIRKLRESYNFYYQEAAHPDISEEYLEERKQMELDADLYAADQIVQKMDLVMGRWGKYLDMEFGYSEMFQLLIPALVIVKENLPTEAYSVKEMENSFYLPNIVRIALTAMVIARKPHIKKVLWNDILTMFLGDDAYRKQFEEENRMSVFADSHQMTETAYERFYSLMIAGTEQTYANIFMGNYLPATFQTDIKAMNWFQYLYK